MSEGTDKPQFELKEDGRVIQNLRGKEILLATYDFESGNLEFASLSMDQKYRVQIQRAVQEDVEGVQTTNKIKSYSISGMSKDEIKANEPPRPKGSKLLGDKTKEVVEWYFRWRPKEAYVRYGVKLDFNNEPVLAHCMRKETALGEDANGLVTQIETTTESKVGMVATRGTHMTFTRNEVVGADIEGDDDEVSE